MAKVITVHINLPDKGAGTLHPVQALSLRQGLYKILPTIDYESKGEKWEFPPGSVVRILEQDVDGKPIFIARDKNSK